MKIIFLFIFSFGFINSAYAEWNIDFSRRYQDILRRDKEEPIMRDVASDEMSSGFLDLILDKEAPIQELAIVNTDSGFIPNRVNIKMGYRYKINLVNVNKKNRNVSFMMDDFSEHHGTYYGEKVSFMITPHKEGVYSFLCPETAARGSLVVYNASTEPEPPVSIRQPAEVKELK